MSAALSFTPDSASYKTSAYPALVQSSDASGARRLLAFDAATDEACYWTFVVPPDFPLTTWTARIVYSMASATSGNVVVDVAVEAITDADALDTDASESFDTTNTSSATAVPGTAGYTDHITITLSNKDSVAVGDLVRLRFTRDANNGSDTASGDLYLHALLLEAA